MSGATYIALALAKADERACAVVRVSDQGRRGELSSEGLPFPNRFQTVLFGRRHGEAETTEPPH